MMSPTRLEAAQIFLSNGQLLTHKYCIPFFEWIWRVWPNLGRSKGKWGQRNVGNYWELLLVFVEGINIGSSRVCHGSIEMMDVSSAGILVLLLPSCKSCKILLLSARAEQTLTHREIPKKTTISPIWFISKGSEKNNSISAMSHYAEFSLLTP